MKVFVQDPGTWLRARGIAMSGHFDPSRPAPLARAHVARVNHEFFFFADADGRERFRADPVRHCGKVTDPVSEERFLPTPASPRLDHRGRPFLFTSDETRAEFKRRPDFYAEPRRKMPDRPEADGDW